MKINKVTIGAEASYKFQKAVLTMEIEGATPEEIAVVQQQLNESAVANARELASLVSDDKPAAKPTVVVVAKPKTTTAAKAISIPTTTVAVEETKKPIAKKTVTKAKSTPANDGVEMAMSKSNKPLLSKDKVHFTKEEFKVAGDMGRPEGKAPWDYTIEEVRNNMK